ncbi:MAG: zinc ribbon domain-containing protein [Christensenellales bacterium]
MICSKCGGHLEEGAKFCPKCGAQAQASRGAFCHKCGAAANTGDSFCLSCGAQLGEAVPGVPAASGPRQYVNQTAKKKKYGKVMALVLLGLIAVAAAVLIPILLGGGDGGAQSVFYLKDNEINCASLSSMNSQEITGSLSENTLSAYEAGILSYYVALSPDGSILFYPDRITDYYSGITLYCKNLKSGGDAIKIDSDVRTYCVNQNASKVYYVKGSDRILYVHNLNDKNKIAEEVARYYINESGSKVIYQTLEGGLYSAESASSYDKVKIDGDSAIVYVSDDLNEIYYLKDGSFYVKTGTADKVKIDSDIKEVIKVYETGEAYYLKSVESELSLMDFVYDDKAAEDALIPPLTEPVYPVFDDDEPWDEYWAEVEEYDADYGLYLEQYSQHQLKADRDNLREALANEKVPQTISTLYYYNGNEKEAITDSYNSYMTYGENNAVIIYSKYNKTDVSKLNLSEISGYWEVYELADAAMYSSGDAYIAIKSSETAVEQTSGLQYRINKSGTAVYFIDDYSEERGYGDLYNMPIQGAKVGKPKIYDDDVYLYYWFMDDSDSFVYFKDVKDSVGDMYVNKNRVDYDVYVYRAGSAVNSDTLVYIVDYNPEKQEGTLKLYDGNKSVKVSDDVYENFYPINSSRILYLRDYNINRGKGDAYMYDGTDTRKKIDDDVTSFIPILKWDYKVIYGW